MPPGSLTVVGTGINPATQLTPEARAAIQLADDVLYLVPDTVSAKVIERLRPDAVSLAGLYELGRERAETYEEMTELILAGVRAGHAVCAAFYGHPGVFVTPGHEAVRRARSEGHPAAMLPAVSAEDCLFADLGLDPAPGCQSWEASVFLARRPLVEPTALLVLWQVGTVGESAATDRTAVAGVAALRARLLDLYGPERLAILYEASPWAGIRPVIDRTTVSGLDPAHVPPYATLVIPPAST